ncbi:MAG: hypothetical protein AAFU55_02835 [Pseudomonadota bacterium]
MNKKSDNKSPDALVVVETEAPVSNKPDEHTRKDPVFFPGGAPNQIFQLNLGFVSYGTDDKSHAASLILSIMLGALMLSLFVIGAIIERAWIPDALKILGPAFTLVAGVAIGKSTSGKQK